VLRFLASVMIVSGVLMLADAGVTLAWQEPISAYRAARDQDRLERELDASTGAAKRDRELTASIRDVRRRVARLAELSKRRAGSGDALGRIELPSLDRHYVFVQGTGTDVLRKGPGHYPATSFPGETGTVAIAGHRTTYGAPFRTIDKLRRGDRIVLRMTYGRFEYRVEKTQIVDNDATWITRRVKGPERLVLSACHPLYSASQRVVAFARLVNVRLS
jgi:sortase A